MFRCPLPRLMFPPLLSLLMTLSSEPGVPTSRPRGARHSWRATCCSLRSFCPAQVACTTSPHTSRATVSWTRCRVRHDLCAQAHVPPRPHGLAHSPGSCSLLSLGRLRCTAVVAAEDFSDPALNADLDKPKTLLPHSDVEPSSMMLQPAGEGEPTRMHAAAVQLAPACLLTECPHGAPLQACPSGCRATCSSRSPTSGRRCST